MHFNAGGINVMFKDLTNLRGYIKLGISEVKAGKITADEFVEMLQNCFEDESCPLSWDDGLIIRAAKKN